MKLVPLSGSTGMIDGANKFAPGERKGRCQETATAGFCCPFVLIAVRLRRLIRDRLRC